MESTTIKVLEDGTLVLPEELRESLEQTPEISISWNEELIVIHRQPQPETGGNIPPDDKNQQLLETQQKLARLKQIIPILEQQIQAQLTINN
ncbi:MAG: hypothetical protein SXA11_23745 [Cyanobacteriota bacterium]|nr:hypothetical protein [Cyanobacteriota bacterium]